MALKRIFYAFVIVLIFTDYNAVAQDLGSIIKEAHSRHISYDFKKAIELYGKCFTTDEGSGTIIPRDTTVDINALNKLLALSQNGENMLNFAYEPTVVSRKGVKYNKFFLYYPWNGSWAATPEELSGKETDNNYIFIPDNADQLFFSAQDNSGSWNIYYTRFNEDSTWSYPEMLNENITSSGDELFPYLAPDGKSLYFSSNGHYGMGGFDIYVSHWDESINDWGIAQNLGFPFSSPYDDFLYYDTPDGNYTLFASNRDTGKDSVMIYALEYENMPLKKSITPEQAREISHLKPLNESKTDESSDIIDNSNIQNGSQNGDSIDYTEYRNIIKVLRNLRREINSNMSQISKNRELYNTLKNETDLKTLARKIEEQEIKVMLLNDSLTNVSNTLQNIEMDFLAKGIIIPRDENNSNDNGNSDNNNSGNIETFVFKQSRLASAPKFLVEAATPPDDITLQINKQNPIIYEFAKLPGGLVYEYKILSSDTNQNVEKFKGIDPIFEQVSNTGKIIYTAGIFRSYADALANINKIKKLGFPSATIIAYNDGKAITIANAKAMEKRLKTTEAQKTVKTTSGAKKKTANEAYKIIIVGYTESISPAVLNVIRENTEKDIAKHIQNGVLTFSIGLFPDKETTESLSEKIQQAATADNHGVANKIIVSVEKVDLK